MDMEAMRPIAKAVGLANLVCLIWRTQPRISRDDTMDTLIVDLESALADLGLTPEGLEQELAKIGPLDMGFTGGTR